MALRIDQYISDLLYSTDCVIIPGLGGFVANTRSAFLNPAQHTFSPPAKRIAFNANLRSNDGLLANHISNQLDISYSEAFLQIQEYVNTSLSTLSSGDVLHINKVGSISYDAEQHLQFEPDLSVNYLTESFGLITIHSPAIRRDEPAGVIRTIKSTKNKSGATKKSRWRLLELIPAAAMLAFLAFSPSLIKNLNSSLSSIIPFNSSSSTNAIADSSTNTVNVAATYPETKFEETAISDSSQAAVVEKSDSSATSLAATVNNVPENKAVDEIKTIEPTQPVSTKVVTNNKGESDQKMLAGNYFVIGGCFKIYENAVRFQQEAFEHGFDAVIIGTNDKGLHMVSLFSSNSSVATIKEMAAIKVEFQKDAWMFSEKN